MEEIKVTVLRNELRITALPKSMIKWMNLAGRPTKWDAKGTRVIEIAVPPQDAKNLFDLGWRIKVNGYDPDQDKWVNSNNMDDAQKLNDAYYKLKITVSYDSLRPPKVFRVVEGKDTKKLMRPNATRGEFDVARIDNDEIVSCDLIINAYRSKKDGKISGYLDTAVFVVKENEVLDKWASFKTEAEDASGDELDEMMS